MQLFFLLSLLMLQNKISDLLPDTVSLETRRKPCHLLGGWMLILFFRPESLAVHKANISEPVQWVQTAVRMACMPQLN